MDTITREYIQTYIQSLIENESDALEKFRENCVENHRPIIQKEVGQFIKVMLNILKPKKILEVGTNVGFSSIFMCNSLNKDVDILSIEINEEVFNEAIENIEKFGCQKNIRVINDDAINALDYITEKFDIAFIDAAKSHYDKFLDKIIKILNPNGVIICDNVLYKGLIANDDLVVKRKRTIVRNMREFLDYISHDKRFETSIIPIGDGVALINLKNV
ncbi:O-methyltransferase [Sedimentibacter sp. zth1]|uniref:O-methyltransferase n=1 Tax=Sedimentibacter sp. zth1 TaxID=2816908 RepID=UPI001A9209A1|nr:O-methyltransferase [Sedimentibacter sp. zth1]QSX06441.1 O-methyltransferase [Sedimentibacter sp. zth1]